MYVERSLPPSLYKCPWPSEMPRTHHGRHLTGWRSPLGRASEQVTSVFTRGFMTPINLDNSLTLSEGPHQGKEGLHHLTHPEVKSNDPKKGWKRAMATQAPQCQWPSVSGAVWAVQLRLCPTRGQCVFLQTCTLSRHLASRLWGLWEANIIIAGKKEIRCRKRLTEEFW